MYTHNRYAPLGAAVFYAGPVAAARENRFNQNYWRVTRVLCFFSGLGTIVGASNYFDKCVRVIIL